MTGEAVGRVEASSNRDWPRGKLGRARARLAGVGAVGRARPRAVDPGAAPVSTALGVLGMTGLTAWYGLFEIGRPQEGETVFVSGAAGAVGSAAGQLAKLRGCRVIGSAGSAEKVAWLRELGFDDAFDYRTTQPLGRARRRHRRVLRQRRRRRRWRPRSARCATYGRIVACGSISRYNATEAEPGPRNLFQVVTKRLLMQGFIICDHYDRFPEFLAEMGPWVRDGRVRYRETVVEGIEAAPSAFIGLLAGENVGKMLVQVGSAP